MAGVPEKCLPFLKDPGGQIELISSCPRKVWSPLPVCVEGRAGQAQQLYLKSP